MMELLLKVLSVMKLSKVRLSMSGVILTVSKRWLGIRTKRTRMQSVSVSDRILVVMTHLDRKIAGPETTFSAL